MRYLKWIVLLVVIVFVFIQLIANIETFSTPLVFTLLLPGGNNMSLKLNFLTAGIALFASGFGIAILIEIYFWYKYSRTIKKQNKMIQSLTKELESLKPSKESPALPSTSRDAKQKAPKAKESSG